MASKECYLYVQTIPHLLRLNLSDFCESGSSPEFEIAYDYATSDGRVPIGMAPIVVGSKIYMVGGENAKKGSMLFKPDGENWFNFDVYVFDHTKSESEDRMVPVRDGDGAAVFGHLNGPKCQPIVFPFEGKFYVLSRIPFLGSLSEHIPPVFEVFDPTLPSPKWKSLPHQPNYHTWDYFAWGHKLLTMRMRDFSIFDAKKEKWEEAWDFLEHITDLDMPTCTPVPTFAGVEFKGIVFAVSMDMNALVAYDLDAGGHLKAHWVLHELSEVFEGPPSLYLGCGFLTDLGGGRMCLLFSGEDDCDWIVRVEVFQVDITTVGDRPTRPEIHREILRSFKLQSWNGLSPVIDCVFMCDHSKKSDIEADSSEAHQSALAKQSVQSCEDLKKRHAIEYVKGDSKKPKTTLPE